MGSTETTNVMPPCDCFNDTDHSQNFNGVWNLVSIFSYFSPYYYYDQGFNVWYFDNVDSTVVICNATEQGPESGNYDFTINSSNQFFLLDSLGNEVFITCCSFGKSYSFDEGDLQIFDEEGVDAPIVSFERND